jgi:signal transduction histidine kinase
MENIKATYEDDEYLDMVVEEIHKDIRLLGIVAERFSKMGASPELRPTNVLENLHRYHQYIKQRASKKIVFDFPNPETHAPILVNINSLLFDWVIENLLKNALDAMEGTGKISIRIESDEQFAYIDFMDTGKGVPKNLYKKIFQPGFSTKKRGWGLGLSLCKRIIETYHKGKIFVKYAVVGEGTIFRVQLPLLPPNTPMSIPTDTTKS